MIQWIARQKFRFDLGGSIMPLVNLGLLTLTAGPQLTYWTGLPGKVLLPAIMIAAVISVWTIGYILDRLRYNQAYQTELNHRNEEFQDLLRK